MDHTNQMLMIAAMGGMVLMVVLLAVQCMKKRKQNQLRGGLSARLMELVSLTSAS